MVALQAWAVRLPAITEIVLVVLAAWPGLVPRQHSTGGKARLLGISKRGEPYLRRLLIHGARAVLRVAPRKHDRRSRWTTGLLERNEMYNAAVAQGERKQDKEFPRVARI